MNEGERERSDDERVGERGGGRRDGPSKAAEA